MPRHPSRTGTWGGPKEKEPCQYEAHRPTDWRLADAELRVCGICHPPARGLEVELVSDATDTDSQ